MHRSIPISIPCCEMIHPLISWKPFKKVSHSIRLIFRGWVVCSCFTVSVLRGEYFRPCQITSKAVSCKNVCRLMIIDSSRIQIMMVLQVISPGGDDFSDDVHNKLAKWFTFCFCHDLWWRTQFPWDYANRHWLSANMWHSKISKLDENIKLTH